MTGGVDVGRLVASLGLNTGPFMAGMKQAETAMARANKNMAATGKALQRYVTLPMLAVGGASLKMAGDFEAAMSKITGLVGVSKDVVDDWGESIKAMSGDVGRGPGELADALYFVASAGIRGAEALEVVEMAAKASTAGLGQTKVVADLVTSAMNAYGKENLTAAQATDVLVAAVKEGKAEASELTAAMGQVLPIASEMGVTFDQVGAALAGMTRTGTSAQIAATQLKAILSGTLGPAENAEEAMQKIGLSAAELRRQIKEEGLSVALENLRKATNRFGKETVAEVFPNIRALVGFLDLMGKNAGANIEIFNSLENATGSLDTAFEEASTTLKGKWSKAVSSGKNALVEIGTIISDAILPAIEKFGQLASGLASRLNEMSEAQKKAALRVAALAAAIGPLLVVISRLNAFIVANPYLALAGALIAATAAIVSFAKANKTLARNYDAVAAAHKKINAEFEEETAQLKFLHSQIHNTNLSNDVRLKAIEKLKGLIPQYTATLSEEGKILNENTKAYNDQLAAIKKRITLQIVEEEYVEALKKQREQVNKLAAAYGDRAGGFGASVLTSSLRLVRMNKQLDKANQVVADLEAEMNRLNISMDKFGGGEDIVPGLDAVETGGQSTTKAAGGGGATSESPLAPVVKDMESISMLGPIVKDSLDFSKITFEGTNSQLLRMGDLLQGVFKNADMIAGTFRMIGETIGDMVTRQAGAFKRFVSSVLDGVGDIVNAMLAEAIAAMLAKETVSKGLVGALAATAIGIPIIKGLFNKHVPEFAEGGLVYGPTVGMMGEYAGARSNPEVIAPLDKLHSMLKPKLPAGLPPKIKLVAEGRDLAATIDLHQLLKNTY